MKKKILEVCLYSAGICGVWNRVAGEAKKLAKKGNKVMVFSTNRIKGTKKGIATAKETKDGVLIKRFPAIYLGGESFMYWDYEKEALKFKPDIIIVHSYRHMHTTKAINIGKKIGAKVFLVTHAPFVAGKRSGGVIGNFAVKGYDSFVGPRTLKKFDKVIAITKWEVPYLLELGLESDQIVYIPNGIPEAYFTHEITKGDKILFFGRVSPVKDIETLLKAIQLLKIKRINFKLEIVGPGERDYLTLLNHMVKRFGLEDEVRFLPAIYDVREKIKKLDSCSVFVLPSLREGMPQSLIEAMARERIVIGSDNMGNKDLIEHGKNGYLFEIGDARALAKYLEKALSEKNTKMMKAARRSVEGFRWDKVMERWNKLIEK